MKFLQRGKILSSVLGARCDQVKCRVSDLAPALPLGLARFFWEPGQDVDNRVEHQVKREPTATDECKTNSMALFLTDTF